LKQIIKISVHKNNMKTEYIIQTKNLSRIYRMGGETVKALDEVDFDVHPGDFVALVGTSGSGKSTLLNLIGGLDRPTSGMVEVCGKDLSVQTSKELALHRRYTVGMVFQSFNLIPSMTAAENVQLALTLAEIGRTDRKRRSLEILAKVGLEGRTQHKPGEMSGGEQQRTAFARALANNPKILLADEPTGNLDSKTSHEMMNLLKSINANGMTIVMVTHNLTLAEEYCENILHLTYGKLASGGQL
jgi:putative ABC transport system ATP-binding protein